MGYVRPKRAKRPANRPKWPSHSFRRRVWATRFFEILDPGAFDEHFFNGLLGSVSFALSAIAAYKLGFTSITLIAAGGKQFNKRHVGYKVWPRFGFDAPVDATDVLEDLRFSSYTCVQEVIANDEALWEEHGSQRMMQFDLSAGSASWRKLLPYVAQKLQILSSNHDQTLHNPSPEGRP